MHINGDIGDRIQHSGGRNDVSLVAVSYPQTVACYSLVIGNWWVYFAQYTYGWYWFLKTMSLYILAIFGNMPLNTVEIHSPITTIDCSSCCVPTVLICCCIMGEMLLWLQHIVPSSLPYTIWLPNYWSDHYNFFTYSC